MNTVFKKNKELRLLVQTHFSPWLFQLQIDSFVSQVTKWVKIIVMTGVEMVKDMMIHITGIHEETCFETWRNDVTMVI